MTDRIKELFQKHRPSLSDPSFEPANSAVLVPLFENRGRIRVIFIRRSETVGLHRGQMGFPGGMSEPADKGDPLQTALREAEEEIGLFPADIEIVGSLSLRPTITSGLRVQPFVGIIPWPYRFCPDPLEIRSIHHSPLGDLAKGVLGEENPYGVMPPVYPVDGLPVWGLTARIVTEMLEVLDPVIDEL